MSEPVSNPDELGRTQTTEPEPACDPGYCYYEHETGECPPGYCTRHLHSKEAMEAQNVT